MYFIYMFNVFILMRFEVLDFLFAFPKFESSYQAARAVSRGRGKFARE